MFLAEELGVDLGACHGVLHSKMTRSSGQNWIRRHCDVSIDYGKESSALRISLT